MYVHIFAGIGVSEDLLEFLPSDPGDPVPTPLLKEIAYRESVQRQAEQEKEVARVQDLFTSNWLINKEKEMVDLQLQIQNCPPGKVRKAKEYLLSTCVEALKLFHADKKPCLDVGLRCRRELLMDNGLLQPSQAFSVKSLHQPVPLPESDYDETLDDNESETPPLSNPNKKQKKC